MTGSLSPLACQSCRVFTVLAALCGSPACLGGSRPAPDAAALDTATVAAARDAATVAAANADAPETSRAPDAAATLTLTMDAGQAATPDSSALADAGVAGSGGRAAAAPAGTAGHVGTQSASMRAAAGRSASAGRAAAGRSAGAGRAAAGAQPPGPAAAGGASAATGAPGPDPATAPADTSLSLPSGQYKLVFSDEFAGQALDTARWCTRLVWTGGSMLELASEQHDRSCTGPDLSLGTGDHLQKEAQRYVWKTTRDEATHVVSNGTLQLRATKTGSDPSAAYESALIRSKFGFMPDAKTSYYVTARVRIPNVKGTFAALWLQAGFGADGVLAWPPEIDVFEAALNEKDDTANMVRIGAHVSIHGPQTATGAEDFVHYTASFDPNYCNYHGAASLRDVWLEFSALWTADQVCYYVNKDNVMCENYHWLTPAGVAANPAQVILDLAIGDEWAGRYGIDDSKFPTAFEVDYVRVYGTR